MNRIPGSVLLCTKLPSWAGLVLLLLIASVPIRQRMLNNDQPLVEQLEHSDTESEQESETEIQKMDGDDFFLEIKSLSCFLSLNKLSTRNIFYYRGETFLLIFDPPPEVQLLFSTSYDQV